MTVSLVVAGPGDWQEWRDLRLRALRSDPDAFGAALEVERTFTEEDWRGRLAGGRAVLARRDREAVGMGGSCSDAPGWWCVVAMWVVPEARGQGIGRLVLDDLLAAATAAGCRVRLWVADGNPARHLYETAGFVATGERAPIRPGAALWKSRLALPG